MTSKILEQELAVLKEVVKDYPRRTIENVIDNIEQRITELGKQQETTMTRENDIGFLL